MTDAADFADEDEDEDLGPSLAYPPLYVLLAATRCPECGRAQHVYALGCAAFADAEEGDRAPLREFHFLSRVKGLPESLRSWLQARLPAFFLDHTHPNEAPYLMNHCPCGAKLDEDWVSGTAGTAFHPDTPEGYGELRLLRLPVEEPIAVVCSYALGGGDHLDFANTWTWPIP